MAMIEEKDEARWVLQLSQFHSGAEDNVQTFFNTFSDLSKSLRITI